MSIGVSKWRSLKYEVIGWFRQLVERTHGIIVRSHIGWGGERNIPYKGVETFP